MTCQVLKDKKGKPVGYVCSRGALTKSTEKCYICGQPAERWCDQPLAPLEIGNEAKTCDKPMCKYHAYRIGPNTDLCREHFHERQRQEQEAKKE